MLYNTLGHCRGHYDMVPVKDYYPTVDRCSWELPVFHELLRRSIRWARRRHVRQLTSIDEEPYGPDTRATPRNASQHGAHPALRGGCRLADGAGQDARLPAPLRRPGSGRRRRVRSVARRRLPHVDAPWSRPSRRQGRRPAAHDGRADGQGDRLLRRQGRVDAHQRPVARDARGQRRRRSRRPDRRRGGVPQQVRRLRPGLGGVLRRRRHEHRSVSRSCQHGLCAASAGRVRVRTQQVRRVHPDAIGRC